MNSAASLPQDRSADRAAMGATELPSDILKRRVGQRHPMLGVGDGEAVALL
jgi:hypothetical protein